MNTANTYVRARVDTTTKERAADVLEGMGLSISNVIRLLMLRIADEQRLPFTPNAASLNARAELEAGKGRKFKTIKALMADLNTKN